MRKFSDPFVAEDVAWCVINNRQDLIPPGLEIPSFGIANEILKGNCSLPKKVSLEELREILPEVAQDVEGLLDEVASEEDEYEAWAIEELKDELKSRSLKTTGNKAALIKRLRDDDGAE